jgi:hypothetical protein
MTGLEDNSREFVVRWKRVEVGPDCRHGGGAGGLGPDGGVAGAHLTHWHCYGIGVCACNRDDHRVAGCEHR